MSPFRLTSSSRGRGRGNNKPPTGGGGPSTTVDHYTVTSSDSAPLQNATVLITAQTKDINDNVFAEAGRTITWSKSGSGGTFSNPTSVTNNQGIATVSFTVGLSGVTHTVTATDTLAKTGTTANIVVGAAPATVDNYLVTPSSTTPLSGAVVGITAQARDAGNAAVLEAGRVVTWSKSGAGGSFASSTSVTNASGIATVNFTVGAVGTVYTVTGTDVAGKTGTTASITVQAPISAVDHYTVSPSSTAPLANAILTITAQARDASNAPVSEAGRVVTWSKTGTGGSFSAPTSNTDASGIATVQFTVGATVGTVYTITGTDAGGKTGTSSSITVQAPSVVGPGPNEPAGMTMLYTHDGTAIQPVGWGPAAGTVTVETDAEKGSVLQFRMAPVTTPGSATCRIDTEPEISSQFCPTRVYIAFYLKLSAGFKGNNGSGSLKNVIVHTQSTYGGLPNGAIHLPALLNDPADVNARIRIYESFINVTDFDGRHHDPADNDQVFSPDAGDILSRGVWHFIENTVDFNSRGQINGSVKAWVDGVLVASAAGIKQLYDGMARLTGVELTNVWGGGGTEIACDQTYRYKNVYISGGFARTGERPNRWVLTSLDGTTVAAGSDVRLVAQLVDENGNSVDIFNPNPSNVVVTNGGTWDYRGGTGPNYTEAEYGRQLYTLHMPATHGTTVRFTVSDAEVFNNFQSTGITRTGFIDITTS